MRSVILSAWSRLHHPRTISAVYGAWWGLAVALGGYSITHPPRTVEAVAGDVLMSLIAAVITLGGIIGAASVARGAYWAERAAVVFTALGLAGYLAMVGYLWWTDDGNRGMQILGIIGGLAFTLLRTHWIGSRPYAAEPRA